MSSTLQRRNNAIAVNGNTINGKTADIAITTAGSSFYFAICAVMGFTSITVLGLSYMKPRSHRIFFYITAALNATACIAYFAMGSNLGFTPINVEFVRSDPVVSGMEREIFYARYIDWVVTTPLLLTDLLLTAGMPWPTILWTIFLDEAMVVTGLIGALTRSRYKFGFYVMGCVAMFLVFWELAVNARAHAKALGNDVYRVFLMCGVLTLFIWTLYPIAWGVSEGGNVISPDSEAVFYGVLDFIAKPCFSAALIYGHWNIDPDRLGLKLHDPAEQAQNLNNNNDAEKNSYDNVGVGTNGNTGAVTSGTDVGTNPHSTTTTTTTGAVSRHDHAGGTGNLQTPNAGLQHGNSGQAPVYDNVTNEQRL